MVGVGARRAVPTEPDKYMVGAPREQPPGEYIRGYPK